MIPLATRETEDSAPWISPISTARLVPTAWLAAPNAMPCAISFLMRKILIRTGPSMLPQMPVSITAMTVIDSMPPRLSETAIAIGVVTLLGSSEEVSASSRAKSLHMSQTDSIDTADAARLPAITAARCFLISCLC